VFGIGFHEIILILMLIIIFIAANRLPEIGRSLGDAMREQQRKKDSGDDSRVDPS